MPNDNIAVDAHGRGIKDGLNAAHDAISAPTSPGFDGMPRHGRERRRMGNPELAARAVSRATASRTRASRSRVTGFSARTKSMLLRLSDKTRNFRR